MYDSIYIKLSKMQTCSDREQISACPGMEVLGSIKRHKENFEGNEYLSLLWCWFQR